MGSNLMIHLIKRAYFLTIGVEALVRLLEIFSVDDPQPYV